MTKREILACLLMGVVAVGLLVLLWPYPGPVNMNEIEKEALRKALEKQFPGNNKNPSAKVSAGPTLEELEKAALKLKRQFPALREAAFKAAKEGILEDVSPYTGELPVPGDVVNVHLDLVLDGKPTHDSKKGRSRLVVKGIQNVDFDNEDKSGPDYELLASVLAALNVRKQADSGKKLVVELVPVPFAPVETVKEAVGAAVRAGIEDIRLMQPPVPN